MDAKGPPETADGAYSSAWLRGFLPAAVLAVIARGETYGYAVAQALEAAGLGHVKGGTLYPVLASLEREGLLAARWAAGEGGPGRKMLVLTPDGLTRLLQYREQWTAFTGAVEHVLAPEPSRGLARPEQVPDDAAQH